MLELEARARGFFEHYVALQVPNGRERTKRGVAGQAKAGSGE
jgi:hypothetical protein